MLSYLSSHPQYKDNTFPPYIQIKKAPPFGSALIKLFCNFSCLISTQFEIVGLMSGAKGENLTNGTDGRAKFYVNGKGVYARILIKKVF